MVECPWRQPVAPAAADGRRLLKRGGISVKGYWWVLLSAAVTAFAVLSMAGCPAGGGGPVEPFPIPTSYTLAFSTPQGMVAHRLVITGPVNGSGHPFEVVIEPVSFGAVGSVSFHSGRTPSGGVSRNGLTIRADVFRLGSSTTAYFRGVAGFETSGLVMASGGRVTVTLSNDLQTCTGSLHLVTDDSLVVETRRVLDGEFTGNLIVPSQDGGDGGGDGGITPPPPPI